MRLNSNFLGMAGCMMLLAVGSASAQSIFVPMDENKPAASTSPAPDSGTSDYTAPNIYGQRPVAPMLVPQAAPPQQPVLPTKRIAVPDPHEPPPGKPRSSTVLNAAKVTVDPTLRGKEAEAAARVAAHINSRPQISVEDMAKNALGVSLDRTSTEIPASQLMATPEQIEAGRKAFASVMSQTPNIKKSPLIIRMMADSSVARVKAQLTLLFQITCQLPAYRVEVNPLGFYDSLDAVTSLVTGGMERVSNLVKTQCATPAGQAQLGKLAMGFRLAQKSGASPTFSKVAGTLTLEGDFTKIDQPDAGRLQGSFFNALR